MIPADFERVWAMRIPGRAVAAVLAALFMSAGGAGSGAEPIVLRGHTAGVFMAGFTPDGGRVVTASGDETARLWDATTGGELRRFTGHAGPVYCLAISGDGRTLVTGGQDNAARVWGLPLSAPRVSFPAHPRAAVAFALLADGRTAVTAGTAPGLRLWRLDQLAPPRPGEPPPAAPLDRKADAAVVIAAAPDAANFATADGAGGLVLWSQHLDEPLGQIGMHAGGVTAVAFPAGGQRLFSGGGDGTLRAWSLPPEPVRRSPPLAAVQDLVAVPQQPLAVVTTAAGTKILDTRSLAVVRELPQTAGSVEAVAASADGSLAAVAGADGSARLFQVADAADRGRVAGHTGAVHDIAFRPDGKSLVTAGADGTVRSWLVPAAATPVDGHSAAVRSLVAAGSGEWFATAGDDKTVRLWNPAGQAVRQIGTHAAAVTALAVSAEDKQIASGDAAGGLAIWGTADGGPAGAVLAHTGTVRAAAFDRDSSGLWSLGTDATLKRWRLPLEPVRQFAAHAQPVRATATTPDGRLIVTGGDDAVVKLWDAATGQAIRPLGGQPAGGVAAVGIAADGGAVAAVTVTGGLRVWKAADGQPLLERMLPAPLHDVAFTDPSRVATLGGDGVVRIWNIAATPEPAPGAEPGPVQATAACRDVPRYAVAGAFGGRQAVVVRDRGDGRELAALTGPTAPIAAIAVSPRGEHVAAGAGAVVHVWHGAGAEPTVLENLPGNVVTIALTDDGQSLFIATGEATIRQWSVGDAREVRSLAGHSGPVRHLAIHGGRLHSAADDGNVITWDVATGARQRTVAVGGTVRSLDVAPDGWIAAATAARTVAVWNPAAAKAPLTSPALPADIAGIRWSPDGSVVAVACGDAVRILDRNALLLDAIAAPNTAACIWRSAGPRLVALRADGGMTPLVVAAEQALPLADPESRVLAANPAGTALVTAAAKRLALWRLDGGRIVAAAPRFLAAGTARVSDVGFSADGRVLAAADDDGRIVSWDASPLPAGNPAPLVTIMHGKPVRSVAVAAAAGRIIACGEDGLAAYDTATGRQVERCLPVAASLACAVTAAGVAAGGQDGSLRLWTPACERIVPLESPDAGATAVFALAGDAGVALVAAGRPGLRRWNRDGKPLPPLLPAVRPVVAASTADGRRAAAVDATGKAFVWQADGDATNGPLPTAAAPRAIAFTRDGGELLVADGARGIVSVTSDTGRLREECPTDGPADLLAVVGPAGRQWVSFGSGPKGAVRERRLIAMWETGAAARAVAVSADGAQVFAGLGDGELREIAVADGRQRVIATAPAAVRELAVAPGGGRIAAADDEGVGVYEIAAGAAARRLPTAAAARRVAFVSEGRRIATADAKGRIDVWDAATAAPLDSFTGHGGGPAVCRGSSDGQSILSAGPDGTLAVWRGNAVASIRVGAERIDDLVVLPGAGQALVAVADGSVQLVDIGGGKVVRGVAEGLPVPIVLAPRPDGQRLAIADGGGTVRILAAGEWREIQRLAVGGKSTRAVWRGDGQRLAVTTAAEKDSPPRIHVFGPPAPPAQPQPGSELEPHDAVAVVSPVIRLAFDRDGRDIWACHADGSLARWTTATPAPLFKLDHGGPVLAVAVSRDGDSIVTGGADQTVRVWDARTGQQRAQMTGHTGAVHALAFTPDEVLVVSAGADRTLRVWDVGGGRQLKRLAATEETQYAVAVRPDGAVVAAGGADRTVQLIELAGGAVQKTLAGHGDFIHGIGFNATGTSLLSYGYAGELKIWDPAGGKPRFESRVGRIGNHAAFSPTGDRVVVSNGDATAALVEVPTGAR